MKLKRLTKYRPFAVAALKGTFAYKWGVLSWATASILGVIMRCLLWRAIFNYGGVEVVGGYTYPQMVAYVFVACVTGQLCYQSTFDELTYTIINGEVGSKLIKPISFRLQLIAQNVGNFIGSLLVIGAGMLALAFGVLGVFFDYPIGLDLLWRLPVYLLSAFLSMLIMEAFCFIFGQVAFVSQSIFGLSQIAECLWSFLSGAVIPLSVFPYWAQNVLKYTPFPYYTSLPVSVLTGGEIGDIAFGLLLQMLWLAAFWLLGNVLFRRSVKRVVSFGG